MTLNSPCQVHHLLELLPFHLGVLLVELDYLESRILLQSDISEVDEHGQGCAIDEVQPLVGFEMVSQEDVIPQGE